MSKAIRLDEDTIVKALEDIGTKLREAKALDGSVSYKLSTPDLKERTKLIFSPVAFVKMTTLVASYSTEVAWHGISERTEDGFVIRDVLVYPQEVTGGTVNTDQKEYESWLMELDDEQFNRVRMQGHSHVNMSTSPSGTDLSHQSKIVDQLTDEDYYIFIIWNKRGEHTVKIYDLANNILYLDKDIDVSVGGVDYDLEEFLDDAADKVWDRKYEVPKPDNKCNSLFDDYYSSYHW